MLITRIELENIKSYQSASIDLRRGTTAISGPNGAGKTTLVEAIGFALFDSLPYNQAGFVREGEKYGRVMVHLIGSDDRPYVVERRCGSGSRWFIYDEEANLRIEQRADVLDKLHDLFGIDRERALDALFKDALGVPQGTFTAIFLEPASKRKLTFDALLQIEDYKTAFDYLLDAQKHYKEQMQTQQVEINRLSYETRELEQWRSGLRELREHYEQQKEQRERCSQLLSHYEQRFIVLTEQRMQLDQLLQRYQQSQDKFRNAQERLREREGLLWAAREAQQVVVACRNDYQRYQQASDSLKQLREQEQRRNALRQQHSAEQNEASIAQTNRDNWQVRLQEVAQARQRLLALAPRVEEQIRLERRREELVQQTARYTSILEESKRLQHKLAQYSRQQEELQRRISTIEPLQAVAALFHERSEDLTQLRIKGNERTSVFRQLQEKQGLLRDKLLERDQLTEKLRKAEKNIAIIEEHRGEAEEMPTLQDQFAQLEAQHHRLEGNIEGYTKSRAQSLGGQCPLLHETCLNIKNRGLLSLEFYFDEQLKEERTRLATIERQQEALNERMEQIKKYVDYLNKLGQYIERRDTLAEQLQRCAIESTRLQRDIDDLTRTLEGLKQVEEKIKEAEAAYNESKQADAQVRELAGLYKQAQQVQEQIHQTEADLRERRQEAEELKESETQLSSVQADLERLNDPRGRSQAQQSIIDQEATFEQHYQEEQQRWEESQQRLRLLQEQLAVFQQLDADIAQQEAIVQQSQDGHRSYLQNEKEARLLPQREQAYTQQVNATEQAARALQNAEQDYSAAKDAFNEDDLTRLGNEIKDLHNDRATLEEKIQRNQHDIEAMEKQIERVEALLAELEAAQQEYHTLEDLHTMMEQFRKLIKEAAPYVLKAMLNDISAEANRIFGEIMGDRSALLSWQSDYEIVLRRGGVNRSFAQLSGGEQMSAALAVRLALLKKLSTLNIAFFDEPTQNMDELRRMNLAEQIRRVRGFDQLIVISHDDTFEQSLDSLVRLSKEQGCTSVQSNDMDARSEEVGLAVF